VSDHDNLPRPYLLLHPEARLTDEEKQLLTAGLIESTGEGEHGHPDEGSHE
jgi:hypothetical protein